jgi:hypothetical protein
MTHKSAETITQQIIHIKIFVSEFHFSDIEKFTGEPKAKKSYIFTKFTKGKKLFSNLTGGAKAPWIRPWTYTYTALSC